MKTIKINGEFTKEELQEKIKEFDKPEWEIKNIGGVLMLFQNDCYRTEILHTHQELRNFNLSTVSRTMAGGMGDLMETKDVLDEHKKGYSIYYDLTNKKWYRNCNEFFVNDKNFKTKETADLAAKLLNESKGMKDWIKRMGE